MESLKCIYFIEGHRIRLRTCLPVRNWSVSDWQLCRRKPKTDVNALDKVLESGLCFT